MKTYYIPLPLLLLITTLTPLATASAGKTVQLSIGAKPASSSILRKRKVVGTSVDATLTKSNDFTIYYANASVGTPPQPMQFHLDTGSSDIWVLAYDAVVNLQNPKAHPDIVAGSFDYMASTTFNVTGEGMYNISYLDGTGSSGDYFQDSFLIGDASVTGQTIGLARNSTTSPGLIGVGFSGNEASLRNEFGEYPNLLDTMVSQEVIETQAYSLWLNDADAKTGSILFGGIDTEKYEGDLSNIAMYPSSEKETKIREFIVSWTSISLTSDSGTSDLTPPIFPATPALLDSGTSLTLLPDEIVTSIYNSLNATYIQGAGILPCNMRYTKGVTLNIGLAGPNGPNIRIPLDELIIPFTFDLNDGQGERQIPYDGVNAANGYACMLGIQPSSTHSNVVIFGDTFLRSMYIVYDLANARVAIAPTKFNTTKSNIVAFESLSAEIPSASSVLDETPVTIFPGANQSVSFTSGQQVTAAFTGSAGPALGSAFSAATSPASTSTGAGGSRSPTGTEASKSTKTGDKDGAAGALRPFEGGHLGLVGLVMGLMAVGGLLVV